MKSIFYTLFITIIFALSARAQNCVESKQTMSLGPQNGFFIEIEGADAKLAQDVLENSTKEYGKWKKNSKSKEYTMLGVKIPMINGSSPLDLYVKYDDGKEMATTYLWVDMGGAFVNSMDHKSQTEGIRTFMTDYYNNVRKKVVEAEVKKEEKQQDKLEKELRKLEDKNKDLHDDIEKYKQKIAEAERNIEVNLENQKAKASEIEQQKMVVEKVVEKLNNIGKSY
ncbi:MAG: hypothetical protein H6567_01810 [Lewinellaceae bacterium]|nr:hypothetical protein [Lewinellaceae bacterium]